MARSGQRLGPGGSGPRAQPPAWPHLAQTRQPGTAQSPAVRLNGLLVLSRKLTTYPAGPGGVGGRGRKVGLAQSPGWPQRQSSPPPRPSPHTHSGLTFYLAICLPVSSLIWPPKGPCTATEPYFSMAPTVLHLSGPLSSCLCLLGLFPSNLDQEILPGFSNHLPPPPPLPWTTAPQESDQCWHLRDLTWQLSDWIPH